MEKYCQRTNNYIEEMMTETKFVKTKDYYEF
jgi:hypothetical protein